MTVGLELSELTGIPLFHNHLSIDAVLPVFEYGSPPFNRLVGLLREQVFVEAVDSDLPGLIFTMVWAFDLESELRFVEKHKAIFESRGGRTVFVELYADLQVRLARNETELRLASKPSHRDTAASRERLLETERTYQLSSNGAFPFPDHLRIDNTHLPPREVAERIVRHFGLPAGTGRT